MRAGEKGEGWLVGWVIESEKRVRGLKRIYIYVYMEEVGRG